MPNRTQRVLIAGGGYAGVRAAQRLLDGRRQADGLEVAMASPENVELWHGLMPQGPGLPDTRLSENCLDRDIPFVA
jgi:NADH dehydrogenase FAD-containing subunit